VIQVLVSGGVDPFIKDIDELIPADLAEQCGYMECSNYLRSIPKQVICLWNYFRICIFNINITQMRVQFTGKLSKERMSTV